MQIGTRVLAILSISVGDQVDEIVNLSMPTTWWGRDHLKFGVNER